MDDDPSCTRARNCMEDDPSCTCVRNLSTWLRCLFQAFCRRNLAVSQVARFLTTYSSFHICYRCPWVFDDLEYSEGGWSDVALGFLLGHRRVFLTLEAYAGKGFVKKAALVAPSMIFLHA
mmetsp:Transcript_7010/g.17534  ORF Transcript_7010/g.17534 Transcript_7010/m.17534 type:complete len:120 (-) Transcript_7010:638-997(-)